MSRRITHGVCIAILPNLTQSLMSRISIRLWRQMFPIPFLRICWLSIQHRTVCRHIASGILVSQMPLYRANTLSIPLKLRVVPTQHHSSVVGRVDHVVVDF